MVTLASPGDFEVFEVADAMVSKSFLDVRKDRDRFMAAVSQTFWREDFATLEQLDRELAESQERFSDGTWILSAFFQAPEVNKDESDERFAEALKKMDAGQAVSRPPRPRSSRKPATISISRVTSAPLICPSLRRNSNARQRSVGNFWRPIRARQLCRSIS